jgi:hypothetical protein
LPQFLLPSGVRVVAQADWAHISGDLCLTERIAYVLARQLKRYVDDPARTQIVYAEGVPLQAAYALTAALGATARVQALQFESIGFSYGDYSPFEAEQPVVLLIDSLLSGRTATGLVGILRRMGAHPIAVAAVIDGRASKGPITTFASSVPVISCLTTPLIANEDDAEPLFVVDPDGTKTTDDASPSPPGFGTGPAEEWKLLNWIGAADAAVYIGHIDRGRMRHFTTYLNVGKLFEHPDIASDLSERVRQRCSGAAQEDASHPLVIIYPADDSGFAERIALALSQKIQRWPNRVVVRAALRNPGGAWRFDGPIPPDCLTVIVDWGAVTTSTIRSLAAAAARWGPRSLLALIVSSQLDAQSEDALGSIASLRTTLRPRGDQRDLFGEETLVDSEAVVPFRFEVLVHARMGLQPSAECQLCAIGRKLRSDAVDAPTYLLRDHARRKHALLRPRLREEILGTEGRDLLQGALEPGEALEVWRRQGELENCRSSTRARVTLTSKILASSVAAQFGEWKAWMRLLAMEPRWLKLPPLELPTVRRHLADQCIAILEIPPDSEPSSRALRWQAAMTLRRASKQRFLDRFGDLVGALTPSDAEVATELIYGMYTLLSRPHNLNRRVLSSALAALLEARHRLVALGPLASRSTVTINALYAQATSLQQQFSHVTPLDAAACVHALQRGYVMGLRTHASALMSMLAVDNAVKSPSARRAATGQAAAPPSDYWRRIREEWEQCTQWLAESAFPYLIGLQSALALRSLAGFDLPRAVKLSDRLRQLEDEPSSFTEAIRRDLEAEVTPWFENVLRGPQSGSRSTEGGARLLRFLAGFPAVLANAWQAAMDKGSAAGHLVRGLLGSVPDDLLVLAPYDVLVEVLAQIVENAASDKHASTNRPADGVLLGIALEVRQDILRLTILNDSSATGPTEGRGLIACSELLEAYGARLSHGTFPLRADVASEGATAHLGPELEKQDWTYFVTIGLRQWR